MLRSLFLNVALLAANPVNAQTADLKIVVDHLAPAQGYLMIGVYAGKQAYDNEVRLRSERVAVAADHLVIDLTGLAPGEYGLKLFHDINGNTRLDSNLLGIPTEPVAFSNNAKGTMGPPPWADAHFTVTTPATVQTIHFRGR